MPGTEQPTAPSSGGNARKVWWAICVFSCIVMIVSVVLLAKRIDAYNHNEHRQIFAYIDLKSPAFAFHGRAVELSETETDGEQTLHIRYGDQSLDLPVTIPPQYHLPTLFDRQGDWMKLLYFADRAGLSFDEFTKGVEDGTLQPRLIIVTRTPFGYEPKAPIFVQHAKNDTWAKVRRDLDRYDFYEFMPDGTILQHEPKQFPESGKSLLRRQNNAKLKGEPIPQRSEHDLQEYTWQYGAAMSVTHNPPAITMEKQALRNSGWTLPAASGGFLVMMVAFFFAIAPARTSA
ncbi:MAG: hypothetical protein KC996_11690 [Phycisphaerales bacterium]|nr:hypothetical protein [Phycisphaerales bacterium]